MNFNVLLLLFFQSHVILSSYAQVPSDVIKSLMCKPQEVIIIPYFQPIRTHVYTLTEFSK